MEPVRDWYRRYFDRVKQEACGSERALVYTLAYDAPSSTISLERTC